MPNRLTAVEIAEAEHEGIVLAAKQALDRGKSSAAVAILLNRQFSVCFTKSTVEKYRRKRWQVQHDALTQQKSDFHTLATEIKDSNLNEAAKALLFQSVRTLSPQTLVAIMRINVQRDNLRLKKQALKKLEKPKALDESTLTPEEKEEKYRNVTNAVKSIFGIGETRSEEPWPKGPYLLLDAEGHGQLPVADGQQDLQPTLMQCVYEQLCKEGGFHGRTYDGPDKPEAISRLKDLYALQHTTWPGDGPQ